MLKIAARNIDPNAKVRGKEYEDYLSDLKENMEGSSFFDV